MEYIYPAIFRVNDDGSYTITFPDLPGCISEGKSLGNALSMAQSALTQWIEYLVNKKQDIPQASVIGTIHIADGEFVNLTRAEIRDERAVRRTVSIPKWMDEQVSASKLSLSRILQDALINKLPQS